MKSLAALLLVTLNLSAAAQTRARPMGEFRVQSTGGNFVAYFVAQSTRQFVLNVNEAIDEASFFASSHCTVAADQAAGWADSTTTLINQQISRSQAPEKIEYQGPELPSQDCVIRVDRTVDTNGSKYSVVVLSRALMLHVSAVATVTPAQALAFVGKIRGTAAATIAMSPGSIAPGLSSNPTIAADTSPTPTNVDQPYFEFQVEKQVALLPDNPPPRYPDPLKSAQVEGEVLAQFVVDTAGRAEMSTFKVLKSTHELFSSSVKSAVATMQFSPAEIAGRKVRQLVQMPFIFGLGPLPPAKPAQKG